MRSKAILIVMLLTVSLVQAEVLLPNGDFQGATFIGRGGNLMPVLWDNANNIVDGGWGNPTVDEGLVTEGANNYVVASIDGTNATPGGYAVIFSEPVLSLAEWGIPAGTEITYSADIKDLIVGGGGPGAILKAEYLNAGGGQIGFEEYPITVTTSWAKYTEAFLIPVTTVSIKCVFGASTGWGGPNSAASSFAFDNFKIGVVTGTPALKPVPKLGAGINPAGAVLSWTNPEGAINADVYLLASTIPLSNPDPRTGVLVANDTTAQSVAVSIQPDRYYYWAVDVNKGTVVQGFTWNFQTLDAPVSNVSAGVDQYVWLVGGTRQFTLTGTYTDDAKSPLTFAWTDNSNPVEQAPGTTVTINSPAAATTTVNVDGDGWFLFTFTVTDAISSGSDQVNVGVYVSPCAAAKEDPADIQAKYPSGHGDIDGDCDVDLNDFALMAASWIDCMSAKLGCTP